MVNQVSGLRSQVSQRGEATLLILLAVVLLGGGAFGLSKTKWFHGESKRAKSSTETTAALVSTTEAQGAAAAAVLTKIGEANTTAPDSRERDFIARAVPIGLGFLPAPDPQKLLELERLKVAVLTGQLATATTLNDNLLADGAKLRRDYAAALAAKRASDLALEQAAAEARGAEQQAFWLTCIAAAAAALYLWTKLSHVSPLSLSAAVRDLREGTTEPNAAIAAIDANVTPFQQANVALNHWLRRKFTKIFS
jgi:hypothetical protein